MNESVKQTACEMGAVIRVERGIIEVLEFLTVYQKDEFVAWCLANKQELPSISWSE